MKTKNETCQTSCQQNDEQVLSYKTLGKTLTWQIDCVENAAKPTKNGFCVPAHIWTDAETFQITLSWLTLTQRTLLKIQIMSLTEILTQSLPTGQIKRLGNFVENGRIPLPQKEVSTPGLQNPHQVIFLPNLSKPDDSNLVHRLKVLK